MTETGQVIRVEGDKVVLHMVRNSACGSCNACSMAAESKQMELTALNVCNAKAGDLVAIRLETDSFLSAVAIAYGIPLLCLLIGMMGSYLLASRLLPMQTEAISILGGLILMLLGFLGIRSQEKKFKKEKYVPKAIEIMERS